MLRDEPTPKPKTQTTKPDKPRNDNLVIVLRSITLFLQIVLVIFNVVQANWFLAILWMVAGGFTGLALFLDLHKPD